MARSHTVESRDMLFSVSNPLSFSLSFSREEEGGIGGTGGGRE